MRGLPVSGLNPACVASIFGFVAKGANRRLAKDFALLEPPAGQRVPYIEPMKALQKLLFHRGHSLQDARSRARKAVIQMKDDMPEDRWVNFLDDFKSNSLECLPLPDFLAWLRSDRGVPAGIIDFLQQAADVTASTPMFFGPDDQDEPWSLKTLPELPPPGAMIQFVPAPPWADDDRAKGWKLTDNPFLCWREAMRPVAHGLEKALGEPVYHFANLHDNADVDIAHRFLVLHWCCSYKPESAYVRYLLKISGAKEVEELKAALIHPASYTQPFQMNPAFCGLKTSFCRFEYLLPRQQITLAMLFSTPEARNGAPVVVPQDQQKTVAVLFPTLETRNGAQIVLSQKIGTHAFVIAPSGLATKEWIELATRYCCSSDVRDLDARILDNPIDTLTGADEWNFIVYKTTHDENSSLDLSEKTDDMMWLVFFRVNINNY
jgi:hypothetical protein